MHDLSISFRIINVVKVIRGMFRISYQTFRQDRNSSRLGLSSVQFIAFNQ